MGKKDSPPDKPQNFKAPAPKPFYFWSVPGVSAPANRVWGYLQRATAKGRPCRASNRALAGSLHMDTRTLKRAVAELLEAGVIERAPDGSGWVRGKTRPMGHRVRLTPALLTAPVPASWVLAAGAALAARENGIGLGARGVSSQFNFSRRTAQRALQWLKQWCRSRARVREEARTETPRGDGETRPPRWRDAPPPDGETRPPRWRDAPTESLEKRYKDSETEKSEHDPNQGENETLSKPDPPQQQNPDFSRKIEKKESDEGWPAILRLFENEMLFNTPSFGDHGQRLRAESFHAQGWSPGQIAKTFKAARKAAGTNWRPYWAKMVIGRDGSPRTPDAIFAERKEPSRPATNRAKSPQAPKPLKDFLPAALKVS